jgi:hypothetical protein
MLSRQAITKDDARRLSPILSTLRDGRGNTEAVHIEISIVAVKCPIEDHFTSFVRQSVSHGVVDAISVDGFKQAGGEACG